MVGVLSWSFDFYYAGNRDTPIHNAAIARFLGEYPDVNIIDVPINVTDASTFSMDTRIAAGMPVHVYQDYMSRSLKYAKLKTQTDQPIWAIDLKKYHTDLDKYLPGVLDPFIKDGQLLALPHPSWMVGMRLNLTLLDKAGYAPPTPENWTLGEFIKMSLAVNQAKVPDTYPTILFAENRSGDWMYMGWFASFGFTKLFTPDYSAPAVNNRQGYAVFDFWRTLWKAGLIPEDSAMLNDDHMINWRVAGLLAAAGDRAGPVNSEKYQQSLVDQEIIEKPYKTALYPFPKAAGVERVPVIIGYECLVGFDSGDEYVNRMIARFIWYLTNAEYQQVLCEENRYFPTRADVKVKLDPVEFDWWYEAQYMMQQNGILDVGSTLSAYNDIRGAMYPQLQKMFTGEYTAQEALDAYDKALREALEKN